MMLFFKTYWIWTGIGLLFLNTTFAQVINTATMDTSDVAKLGKVTVGGYVDAYYGYNINDPDTKETPYFVSSARHNEVNINLAYIDLKYSHERVRARFVPALGTYMNANYTNEPLTLKHIVEGNVGFKPFKKKDIWIDAGVLGSPYTNESAISKDHLMYSRSLAPEYVPYYLCGVKVSIPLHKKWTAFLYLLNGWQVIMDNNKGKSLGTQLEFRPNDKMLFNWNTYIGDESTKLNPANKTRYFSDIYWIYNYKKWSATACIYAGIQERADSIRTKNRHLAWGQANFIAKYSFTESLSLSGRIEYFYDPHQIQITSINPFTRGFQTFSTGLCFNWNITKNALFRVEGRYFYSPDAVYQYGTNRFANDMLWFMSNVTIWF